MHRKSTDQTRVMLYEYIHIGGGYRDRKHQMKRKTTSALLAGSDLLERRACVT